MRYHFAANESLGKLLVRDNTIFSRRFIADGWQIVYRLRFVPLACFHVSAVLYHDYPIKYFADLCSNPDQ